MTLFSCRLVRTATLVVISLCVGGCNKPAKSDAKVAPAKVEMIPHETELATLTLTADAVKRLAIKTAMVEKKSVSRHRTFAGEAMVPSGMSIIVAAPVPGVIAAVGKSIPLPGSKVLIAAPVMILKPLLSPERDVPTPAEQVQMTGARANLMSTLVIAQGDVARSESEIEGLKIARNRAQKLLDDRAGSRRALDDVEALLNIAQSVLSAAKLRQTELASLLKSLDSANEGGLTEPASPLTLTAPVSGLVRNVNVSAGQTVTAGAPLFEVVDLSTIWVRVPIYVDLLSTLKRDQDATLVSLDGTSLGGRSDQTLGGSSGIGQTLASAATNSIAKPISAPPTADAVSSSADLYYEVDNRALKLRPGQRVGMDVPMISVTEALVVPTASILYDIYGGTWVYVQHAQSTDNSKFVRERVLLEWVEGDTAVISQGPIAGSNVVTDGAAELFGTEFGAGK